MSQDTTKVVATVEKVIAEVVSKEAAAVDAQGAFPTKSIAAVRAAGLLGLVSAEAVGGMGHGHRAAAEVVERLAQACGSTAMVVCMHYAGAAVLERVGPEPVRREIAAGRHLSTLALSDVGSRSQFWAPVGTAKRTPDGVVIDGQKSFITSATHADAFVWSTRPVAAEGLSTLWLIPRGHAGLRNGTPFDGLGLRGNDSSPVTAEHVVVKESAMLGEDGKGLAVMLEAVMPFFNLMNAAFSVGLMESATAQAVAHASGTRFAHDGTSLRELPTIRASLARMRVATDMARALVRDTADAIEGGRPDTMLRVLESKAAAGEAATSVLDLGMRVCGGAAFRKQIGIERAFRDGRAASVMGPTTDVLYDFIGKALTGLPVF
jgi:alkylation response protein AidB-like acyl-CoA dehydrogenase